MGIANSRRITPKSQISNLKFFRAALRIKPSTNRRKMTRSIMKFDSRLSRRSFIVGAGQVGAAAGLASWLPERLARGQGVKGKERLIVRSVRPEDLETPVGLLNSWITPNELFYVR